MTGGALIGIRFANLEMVALELNIFNFFVAKQGGKLLFGMVFN
jgi:hypothetical protein